MITRRALVFTAATALLATATPPALAAAGRDDPAAIVTAIYTRAARGKGDSGGSFIMATVAAKGKYFSKSLIALWNKSDARIQKGDAGPIAFDPVTNSQDPDLKSFTVKVEKSDADKATIAVTIANSGQPRSHAADKVLRYAFVRDTGPWKIDDIRGAVDGKPWSMRALLTESLKY
jgi:hypothetical protein